MCGIFGLIYHGTGRTREQVNASADLFTTLAVQSAERGVDATGLARVDSDGYMALYKNCLPSYEVVNFKRWWRPLLNISPSTVAVLGHTRYGTHGDNTQDNAHPFLFSSKDGEFVGTHNGVISNHADFGPATPFANDSANLFHGLASEEPEKWGDLLREVRGSFALVFARGAEVYMARNIGSPCYSVYVPSLDATAYASTYTILLSSIKTCKLEGVGTPKSVEQGVLYHYAPFTALPKISRFEAPQRVATWETWRGSQTHRRSPWLDASSPTRRDVADAFGLQDDSVIRCDRCGREDFWKFSTSVSAGAILCGFCSASHGDFEDEVACESCGILTPVANMAEDTAGGEFICKDCLAEGVEESEETFYRCSRCKEAYPEADLDREIMYLDSVQGFVCFGCFTESDCWADADDKCNLTSM